jgi:hypothetical protein
MTEINLSKSWPKIRNSINSKSRYLSYLERRNLNANLNTNIQLNNENQMDSNENVEL